MQSLNPELVCDVQFIPSALDAALHRMRIFNLNVRYLLPFPPLIRRYIQVGQIQGIHDTTPMKNRKEQKTTRNHCFIATTKFGWSRIANIFYYVFFSDLAYLTFLVMDSERTP